MKSITFEESKLILVDTLKSIDKCCRENNIKYSLSWGTLLGAIRHKGFIPWDDDVDLMMSRKDYNKFIEVYNDPKFKIYTPSRDKNCIQLLTKVYRKDTKVIFDYYKKKSQYGLWISIFPYDNAPDEGLREWEKTRTFLLNLYHYRTVRLLDTDSIFRKTVKLLLKIPVLPFSSFFLERRIEQHLSKYNSQKIKCISIWDSDKYFVHYKYFPSELFDEYIDAEFSGAKCMIIKEYDKFLRMFYGDYMELPPESERVIKHKYKAYYTE